MPTPQLPIDIFLHIIEFIDHPGDLLSLALTSRTLHTVIVPRHIEYRRISCAVSSDHVWKHLLDNPRDCSRIRYLDITLGSRTVFPRTCRIDSYSGTSPVRGRYFLQALSKMVNLKVFQLDTESPRPTVWAISEAIDKACCELEELQVHTIFSNRLIGASRDSNEIQGFSLFHDLMPSLQKYTIRDQNAPDNFRMLLNAPNLTHMNVTCLPSPAFLMGHWSNLQHLTFRNFVGDDTENEIHNLIDFFHRHPKLITLSTNATLCLDWESDDFLPNLRSFGIATYTLNYGIQVTSIPSHVAIRLTHLDMTPILYSCLKIHGTILPNLKTCLYLEPDPEISMQDLVNLIPNVQKLYIRYSPQTLLRSLTNANKIIEHVRFFADFKRLRVLIGPFDGIEISYDDHPLFKFLYNFPSLLYIRAELKRSGLQQILCLERDNIAKVMRYIPMNRCPAECDIISWGGFYRCN